MARHGNTLGAEIRVLWADELPTVSDYRCDFSVVQPA
jgi:hypothetical protein